MLEGRSGYAFHDDVGCRYIFCSVLEYGVDPWAGDGCRVSDEEHGLAFEGVDLDTVFDYEVGAYSDDFAG